MRREKLHINVTMMGGPRRTGMCVAILVLTVAQAAAQAGDNLQEADDTGEQPQPPPSAQPGGFEKFPNGYKGTSLNFGTAETPEYLEAIGGRVIKKSGITTLNIGEHSYKLDVASEGQQINGHTGKAAEMTLRRGLATQEGQRPSGVSDSTRMNSPGEDKHPQVPGDESAGWSREADLWRFREGKWKEVRLPDDSYPSLPTPDPPAAALIVDTNEKVEVERNLEGLKNVAIHCRFYLSDSHHPDTLPELEVYFVKDGFRKRLVVETTPGAWQEQTIHVPEADNSSIIIEGWRKAEGDIIALSNLYTTGVTPARDEALDADSDQMTLTANTTENVTSTLETEGNWTTAADQDNATRSSVGGDTQGSALPSPTEGDTEEGTGATMPTDEFELEAATNIPESETHATEQVNRSTDVVALNSSMLGGDNMTSGGSVSSDFNSTVTTTDAENKDTDGEEKSTTATVTDGESGASQIGTEDSFETSGKEDSSTTLSVPGVTTDSLQINASVTLPHGNATATGGSLITTKASVNSETPSGISAETRFTAGQNLSTNVFETDKGSSDTTLGIPESSATVGNDTFPGGVTMESTPSLAGNSTEAVVAVPVSSTSWQVFQIFLVLCVMGLLALGFLYWKRRRRQDDEIPVFTRHTDYPNPTFTMEDAANFMSRAGRNTYKTIE